MSSPDDELLGAYRKQIRHLVQTGGEPGLALLAWQGQEGVSQKDLIDIYKEETGAP